MNKAKNKYTLKFIRPDNAVAGFRASCPEGINFPLREVGEHWASKGFQVPEHSNQGWEVYLQIAGGSDWVVGKKHFSLKAGSYYLIPPKQRHRLVKFTTKNVHFIYIVFSAETLGVQELADLTTHWPPRAHYGNNGYRLEPSLRAVIREVSQRDIYNKLALQGCLSLVLVELSRIIAGDALPKDDLFNTLHPGVSHARELMLARPEHPWRLDELAALSGISAQHLIACFHRDLGETPMRHLLRIRVQYAVEALRESGASVTEIAYRFGFSSSQHLSKAFAAEQGMSPTQFRRSL